MDITMDAPNDISKIEAVRIPKRKCLIAILVVYAFYGLLGGILSEDSIILTFCDIAVPLLTSTMIVLWCHLDSEQWDFSISKRLSIMLFLLWIIAFPYYLSIVRRGVTYYKTLGLATIFFILIVCLYTVSYGIGCLIYEGGY